MRRKPRGYVLDPYSTQQGHILEIRTHYNKLVQALHFTSIDSMRVAERTMKDIESADPNRYKFTIYPANWRKA